MLARENRLKKRKSFNYIYRKGRSVGNEYLTLVFVYARGTAKVGFSVSKKVGNSVIRHRVTRQMRAAMRALMPQVRVHNSMIFIAKESMKDISTEVIKDAMDKALAKAGLKNADMIKGVKAENSK